MSEDTTMPADAKPDYTSVVAEIVSAFVSNNSVRMQELPELIASVHASISGIATETQPAEPAPELTPAVSIKKSITNDYMISLEDGKKFKSLKRHLMASYGLTPDDYRRKWGLPSDYPMVAPGYSKQRSELAKEIGLGNIKSSSAPKPVKLVPKASKGRGRPKKDATQAAEAAE